MNFKKTAYILLAVSLLAMMTQLIMLGFRQNTEHIITAEHTDAFTITNTGEDTFFVCTPEKTNTPPKNLEIELDPPVVNGVLPPAVISNLELSEQRPLTLPQTFADKYHTSQDVYCAVSETIQIDPGTLITDPQEDAIIIHAHSDAPPSALDNILFFIFLAGLWISMACWSKSSTDLPKYTRFDGIIAFVLALIIAAGIAALSINCLPPDPDLLFPGYGEILTLLAANFIGFFGASLLITLWRNRKYTPAPDAAPKSFPIWIPLGLGLILPILAALSVSFAPVPGLNTAEMASVLVSTRYVTAQFAVLAGICEEFLFRGVIQSSFMARPDSHHPVLQNAIAIAIATTLFVGMHVPQSVEHLWALIPIAIVSITAGILRVKSQSLFPSILLHITYNSTLLLISFFAENTQL